MGQEGGGEVAVPGGGVVAGRVGGEEGGGQLRVRVCWREGQAWVQVGLARILAESGLNSLHE